MRHFKSWGGGRSKGENFNRPSWKGAAKFQLLKGVETETSRERVTSLVRGGRLVKIWG